MERNMAQRSSSLSTNSAAPVPQKSAIISDPGSHFRTSDRTPHAKPSINDVEEEPTVTSACRKHSKMFLSSCRIDCEGGDFAGLILLAGSPRRLEEILLDQTAEMAAAMPGLTGKILQKQLAKYQKTFAGLYDLTDEQAKAVKFGGGTTLYYFKEMGQPTVAQWLEKTRKPMLILQGEKDVQAKAKVDFAGYKQILGDRENVSFRLYPNLNHCFVPARFDSLADAKKEFTPERHIGKDVLDDIAHWIMEQS